MKKTTRASIIIFLILATLLSACSSTAVGNSPDPSASANPSAAASVQPSASSTPDDSLEPITFDVFLPWMDAKIPPDDSPIMQQLFEKTGVRLNRIIPPTAAEERLNIMLASGDLPDLIRFDKASTMQQYIDAGKLLKLNDLLEQNAPKLFNENWASFKGRIADKNGDFWFMPGNYTFGEGNIDTHMAFNMRNDYLEEFGYDKAPNTIEDVANLLRDVKKWNPDVIPMGLALGPQGYLNDLVHIGAAANGLAYQNSWQSNGDSLILDKKSGDLIYYTSSPEVKAFLKYLNDLNVEGLIDPESPIMSVEMLKQKAVANQIWSYYGHWWEIGSEVSAYEKSIGTDIRELKFFPVADKSVTAATYSPYSVNMFTVGMTLTHKHKDPERYLQFIEYINTEEGWLDAQGIIQFDHTGDNTEQSTEGFDYIVRTDLLRDNKPVFEPSAWMTKMWGSDENWWWNRGVENMADFTYSIDILHKDSKYSPREKDSSTWWDDVDKRIYGLLGFDGKSYSKYYVSMAVDISEFSGIDILPDMPEYTQALAVRKAHETMLPRVIMAASSEAFETEWNAYVAELEKCGLQAVLKKYNQLYHDRLDAWAAASN